MNRIKLFLILLVIAAILCGCASQSNRTDSPEDLTNTTEEAQADSPSDLHPADTNVPQTEPAENGTAQQAETEPAVETDFVEEPQVSSAFSKLFPNSDALGLLYNEPFRYGELQATVIWNTEAYDLLYLIPRCAGTIVRAYEVDYDDEKMVIAKEPTYETVSVDGTVISAALARPEGGPAWYVEMSSEEGGSGGMLLEYNGRTGTAQFEFIEAISDEVRDSAEAFTQISLSDYAAFLKAAEKAELSVSEAADLYDSRFLEIGDGAAFVRTAGGISEAGSCALLCARFHTNYYTPHDDLEESVIDQYKLYGEIGNEKGILGPDYIGSLPDLYFELTGLTVYNRSLAAKQIQVFVNGEDAGTFTLSDGALCNLIPLKLSPMIADSPVKIEVKVISTYYGKADDAAIEVFPGLGGNISNAL